MSRRLRFHHLVGYQFPLLMQDCQSTGDIQSKLKRLFAGTIEQMLESEMEEHLGYEKHSVEGNNSGNSRNGYNHKTIISDYGESEIAIPRDRNVANPNLIFSFGRKHLIQNVFALFVLCFVGVGYRLCFNTVCT